MQRPASLSPGKAMAWSIFPGGCLPKPASSDARPLLMTRLCRGGCSDTRKASDKKPGEAAVLWIKRGDVEALQNAREQYSQLSREI